MDENIRSFFAEKLAKKIDINKIEKMSGDEIKVLVENSIKESELELKEIRIKSDKIVNESNQKIDAFQLFWYAIFASFLVNIEASYVWEKLKNIPIFVDVVGFTIIPACLVFLLSKMIREIRKHWKDANYSDPILKKIYDEVVIDKKQK